MMTVMQIARVDRNLTEAHISGQRGVCPACDAEVVARVGEINVPHWAHLAGENDCDPWAEGESPWHSWWKTAVPMSRREMVIGPHRADAVASDGTVCELQHSPIAVETIAERELFYGDMRWIFDARDKEFEFEERGHGFAAWRKHRWPAIGACRRRVMLDFGEDVGVLSCEKINETGSYVWGRLYRHHLIRMWLAGSQYPQLWRAAPSETTDGSLRRLLLDVLADGDATLGEIHLHTGRYGLQEVADELSVMVADGLAVESERLLFGPSMTAVA